MLPPARARANRGFPAEWRSKRNARQNGVQHPRGVGVGKIEEERASWRGVQAHRVHPSHRGGANRGRFPRFAQRESGSPAPPVGWLSKQNYRRVFFFPVVGHPRRRGAKDDRDEDAVAGVPARLVLHRLFLRGRVRAASIGVSHWCVRGLRRAGSVTVSDQKGRGRFLGYGSFGGNRCSAAKAGGGTRVPRSYRAIYSWKRRGRSVKFARANVCADFSVSGGWGHAVRGGGAGGALF